MTPFETAPTTPYADHLGFLSMVYFGMNEPTYYKFLVADCWVTRRPSSKGASSKNPLQRGSHLRPWDRMTNFTKLAQGLISRLGYAVTSKFTGIFSLFFLSL